MDPSEEISGKFVIARGDRPKLLEFVEEALDQVALAIECEIASARRLAVGLGRNHRGDLTPLERFDKAVGVERLVAKQRPWLDTFQQRLRARQVVRLACREHQSTGLPSASTRPWILVVSPPRERPIACLPFFSCPGAMLVGAHNGGVQHHVFVIVVARQQLESALENAALRPSIEALVDDVPIPETLRKIAPRNAGAKPEQNRFDKQTIVRRRTSYMFASGFGSNR